MNDSYSPDSYVDDGNEAAYRPMPIKKGLDIGDIYYTLFRHKWKILICGLLGLAVGGYIFYNAPKEYRSEARLFIRYITEDRNPAAESGMGVRSIGDSSFIVAEIAILTSLDLAQKVADAVGYEKLLGVPTGPEGKYAAAQVIKAGLDIDVPKSSSVLEINFRHSNPQVVQPVLATIIEQYLKRHREVHMPVGAFDDALIQQTDTLQARLRRTEEELVNARKAVGIYSLDQAKEEFGKKISQLRSLIFEAEAALAERTATYNRIMSSPDAPVRSDKIQVVEPEAPVDMTGVPVDDYKSLLSRLDAAKKRVDEMLKTMLPTANPVKAFRNLITDYENQKTEMEAKYPVLVKVPTPTPTVVLTDKTAENRVKVFDPKAARVEIEALSTRIQVLNSQLEKVRQESAEVEKSEVTIRDLELRKSMEEANFKYLRSSLEQSRINDALGTGRQTNINEIQTPSPPIRVTSKAIKLAAVVAAAGFAIGIGFAFLKDLILDRTIKRPVDVARHAGLNLYLSIPRVSGRKRNQKALPQKALAGGKSDREPGKPPGASGMEPDSRLQPYYDTLRDRVIGFFESENLTHKPKLIALAGVGTNANDASVAAGLASSLSETEGGNVLYVDMTTGQGSAQQFFKGQAVGSIDDALQSKDTAQVQQNLFVVSEVGKGDRLPRALPMRFSHLIPKLKASDFDFIIFNMPSVSSVSVTPRLAAFMDVVLLVIESEKADRDAVARARDLLAESKTPVGAVLNNTRSYVPKALHQDATDLV
jgi:succinoglycan biosynthesis transport protein ExoP